jgi:methionine salvage enolase-phosphatase E1|tara:strand:- start:336 stop:572 length:237 start_codon:yes stop_codon:yes gene_type:complete
MNRNSIWSEERSEIATWLSGYLSMIKKWVDKILDNEDHDVNKNKIINLLDEWIQWLEDTKKKIMMMQDVTPEDKKPED